MKKYLIALAATLVCSSSFAGTLPWADTVFVRGGFNDWGTTDPMSYDGGSESYTAIVNIAAGDWEFKIANADWNNPDFGPTGDPVVTLGVATDIGTAIGANFMLSIVDPGNYLFTLFNLDGPVGGAPDSGQLIVERVVPIPAAGLLLLSALGGLGFLRRRS